jgi:SAM-dependent methyltransferase
VQRAGDLVAEILERIDLRAWRELEATWRATGNPGFSTGHFKFFDLERWLPGAIRLAEDLGLVGAPPRRILDIGSGSGLFARVCRHLGHDATGLDIGSPMFDQMCMALEVPCVTHILHAGEPLPADLRDLDLITAINTKFHRHDTIRGVRHVFDWDVLAWRFFLGDIAGRLRREGALRMKLNATDELPEEVHGLLDGGRLARPREYHFARPDLLALAAHT